MDATDSHSGGLNLGWGYREVATKKRTEVDNNTINDNSNAYSSDSDNSIAPELTTIVPKNIKLYTKKGYKLKRDKIVVHNKYKIKGKMNVYGATVKIKVGKKKYKKAKVEGNKFTFKFNGKISSDTNVRLKINAPNCYTYTSDLYFEI